MKLDYVAVRVVYRQSKVTLDGVADGENRRTELKVMP